MKEVTVNQLAALAEPTIVDVRERFEFAPGHVPHAHSIPLGELMARQLELPKDQPIYVICQSGGRSMQATQYLDSVGYNAINVTGGTAAWLSAHLPIER